MCLLVHQPQGVKFSDDFLRDVYSSNRDGLGVMFAEAGEVYVKKTLPADAQAFVDFYRAHADGRECIWHARMQTHGAIDLDNCHPYEVTPRVFLAHNGILATGNEWDERRSDTWHFIRNVVRPAVLGDESLVLDPTWQAFLGDLIGSSNKFGIMTASGEAVIINRSSGVEFAGAWLSNTYAWSAHRWGVGSKLGRYTSSSIWDYRWDEVPYVSSSSASASSSSTGDSLVRITRAARNCYVRGTLAQWVADAPHKASTLANAIAEDETGETGEGVWFAPDEIVELIAEWFEGEGLEDPRAKLDTLRAEPLRIAMD